MQKVRIRVRPGRVAYSAPTGGRRLTADDGWVTVPLTAWVQRLIEVHGDVEVEQPEAPPAPAAAPATSAVKPAPASPPSPAAPAAAEPAAAQAKRGKPTSDSTQ